MHNMLIYGLLCIKCVKNTKGAIFQLLKNFGQSPTRPGYTAVYPAVLHCHTSTRPGYMAVCQAVSVLQNAYNMPFSSCNTYNKGHNTCNHYNTQL